jgi:ATP-dependent exoDNAse (exonuclease V) alpha subunit
VFLQVIAWYKATLRAEQDVNVPPEPLRINIDGTAGTGKSFLISAISAELQNLASHENKPNPVMRFAPTGIAAFGINGMTIHSALSISVKSFNALTPSSLSKFQHQWKDIKLLIIDEKSMVGRTMAGKLDSRLQQILTDKVMGGIGVLLFGDFAQLPPVGDSPLYSSKIPLKPLPMLEGMFTSPLTNQPPSNVSFVSKVMIQYLNNSVIFCSINEHTLLLREIITSSQPAFPQMYQLKKNTPSTMQSAYFPYECLLMITIIIILNLHMPQYSVVKPDTVEENMQKMQLRTRQMVLRQRCFWLLELG